MFWRLTDPLFVDMYLATEIYFILNLMQKKIEKSSKIQIYVTT